MTFLTGVILLAWWPWNGWLNPKGSVICLFALWRSQEQDFVALLPDFPAAELQPLL